MQISGSVSQLGGLVIVPALRLKGQGSYFKPTHATGNRSPGLAFMALYSTHINATIART